MTLLSAMLGLWWDLFVYGNVATLAWLWKHAKYPASEGNQAVVVSSDKWITLDMFILIFMYELTTLQLVWHGAIFTGSLYWPPVAAVDSTHPSLARPLLVVLLGVYGVLIFMLARAAVEGLLEGGYVDRVSRTWGQGASQPVMPSALSLRALRSFAFPKPIQPHGTVWKERIVYVNEAELITNRESFRGYRSRFNTLDVLYHKKHVDGPRPVLFNIHGGGWRFGSSKYASIPLCYHMASKGWVIVNINYRYHPAPTKTEGLGFPAHLIDCKRALRWTRQNIAGYGGNPDCVFVTGGSAGGHLAALMALTENVSMWQPGFEAVDTSVRGCVPCYGVYDIVDSQSTRSMGFHVFVKYTLMRCSMKTDLELWQQACPTTQLHRQAPPFLVVHGGNDNLTPVLTATKFVSDYEEITGRRCHSLILPNGVHAFDILDTPRTLYTNVAIERFLVERLADCTLPPLTSKAPVAADKRD